MQSPLSRLEMSVLQTQERTRATCVPGFQFVRACCQQLPSLRLAPAHHSSTPSSSHKIISPLGSQAKLSTYKETSPASEVHEHRPEAAAMTSGIMTPGALGAAPSTPNFSTASLSNIQDFVDAEGILTVEDALQEEKDAQRAVVAAEKVLLLARHQRDTCKTRKKLAAHEATQARMAKKAESHGDLKKKPDKKRKEKHRSGEKDKTSKKSRRSSKKKSPRSPQDKKIRSAVDAEEAQEEGTQASKEGAEVADAEQAQLREDVRQPREEGEQGEDQDDDAGEDPEETDNPKD